MELVHTAKGLTMQDKRLALRDESLIFKDKRLILQDERLFQRLTGLAREAKTPINEVKSLGYNGKRMKCFNFRQIFSSAGP